MDGGDREPRTTTVTVLFCDLVGSTARMQLLGDDDADDFRRAFFSCMREAVAATHGEVVKNTGDGVMVVFRDSAVSAVTCAATMHDKVEALDVYPQAVIRVGVSAGEVAAEHGDYFGTPVIEAARLCDAAEAGQTLVSDVVRALVGSRGGQSFRSVGALTLKGLTEPVASAAIVRDAVVAPKRPTPSRGRRRKRWPYAVGAAVVVTAIAVVVATLVLPDDHAKPQALVPAASTGYTPRVEPAACEAQFRKTSRNTSCGVLVVPEDRANPKGRWIRVEYRRYAAKPGATSDKTVVDVGDPALPNPTGSGAGDLDTSGSGPVMAGLGGADLVVIASRGMYRSTPALECPEFDKVGPDVVSHAQGDPAVVTRGQRALRSCYTRLVHAGIDPAHYRLADQAADVIDLVHALRLRSVDLAAGNDGALIAFSVASMVPDSVRSVALVNPAAPTESFRADATQSLAGVFDHFVSLCQADARCRRAYPDLARDYAKVNRDYAAHPRVVKSGSGLASVGQLMGVPVRLDGGHIAQALAAAFEGDPAALPLIPQAIEHPNDDLNAELAASEEYPLLLPHFPWGGYLSRICQDESMGAIVNSQASRIARPEFAGYDDPAFGWMCDAWRVPLVQTIPTVPDGIPVFAARADLSPRQNMGALDSIRTGNHARVFEVQVPTPSGVLGRFPACYTDLRAAFERDPAGPLDIAGCERQQAKIAFVTPSG